MASRLWLGIALTAALALGCKAKSQAPDPAPSASDAVTTVMAVKPAPRRTLTLYGTLKTDEDRIGIVTSPVDGKVRRIFVKEGDDVRAGQALLELESRQFAEAELAYRKALSELRYQAAIVDRDQALFKQGALAGDELKADKTALAKAKADLSAAETQLQIDHGTAADLRRLRAGGAVQGTITVTAPITGHVLVRSVRLGEAVPTERSLMTVVDHSRLWVLARIPENEIARVKEAGTAEVRLKAAPDRAYVGHVIHVHDEVDKGTRTLELKLWVENPGHLLRPEMFATVALPVTGETGGAEIPRAALQASPDGDVVIVKGPQGYAMRPVKVLEPIGDAALRVSGIQPGTAVVTEGADVIKAQLAPAPGDDE